MIITEKIGLKSIAYEIDGSRSKFENSISFLSVQKKTCIINSPKMIKW